MRSIPNELNEEEKHWIDAPLGRPVYKRPKKKIEKAFKLYIELATTQTSQPQTRNGEKKQEKRGTGLTRLFARK
jgi:hypothetical protein